MDSWLRTSYHQRTIRVHQVLSARAAVQGDTLSRSGLPVAAAVVQCPPVRRHRGTRCRAAGWIRHAVQPKPRAHGGEPHHRVHLCDLPTTGGPAGVYQVHARLLRAMHPAVDAAQFRGGWRLSLPHLQRQSASGGAWDPQGCVPARVARPLEGAVRLPAARAGLHLDGRIFRG